MKDCQTHMVRDALKPFLLLFIFWTMLIPETTTSSIVIGLIVCTGTIVFSRQILFHRVEFPPYNVRTLPAYFRLLAKLVVEVFRANVEVAMIVLRPHLDIQPHFVRVPVSYRTQFNRVVHAQCITLTPGTISVEIGEDWILVHALTSRSAEELHQGFPDSLLQKTEAGFRE